ncbi:MAG: ABC transporter substrate-binding protein [Candidatus Omnitrophota bacterium]
MKKIRFILITVIALVSFSAFAESLLKEPYKDYKLSCGRPGGELVVPATSDPKSFNPIVAQETSTTQVTSYIFEGLTRTHPLTLEVLPNLAKSWKVSADGKEWIFYLRQDIKWNDGEKFKAKDVVFTFNSLIYNPDIPASSRDIFTIEGNKIIVEEAGDYAVKFKLPFVFAPFLRALSQDILPAHKYKNLVQEGKFSFGLALDSKPEDVVGTGPFKLKKYLAGERVILERNPYYYKKDACDNKLPYLDKVVIVILSNADTALLKFIEREVDYYALRPHDLGILGPLKKKQNFTIYNAGPALGSNFLVLNQNLGINPKTKKPFVSPYKLNWFQDRRFRRAISYALDRKKIINLIMNGLGLEQFSPVTAANTYYYNDKVKKHSYNPKKAKEILSELEFSDTNADGFLEDKLGNELEVNFFTSANDTQRVQIASLIKKDLEAVGIKVYFLPLDFNNLVNKLTVTFDWEMVLIGLTGGIEPYFGKNVWSYEGNLHMWNYSKKPIADYESKIESIFNLSAKTLDEEKRKEQFAQWQEIVSEELPLIYTVVPYSIYAVRNRFGNLHPTVYGGAFSEIEYIYLKDLN